MSGQPYLTAARLKALDQLLKPRQRSVLRTIDRCNVASAAQLRRLFYEDSAAGRRLARLDLAWLVEHRLLSRLERRVGGVRAGSEGFVYGLDIGGQRLLRPNQRRYRPAWTPQPQHLTHALGVTELYVDLTTTAGPNQLTQFDAEPRCWRSFAGPGGSPTVLKPDAFVITESDLYEDRYFIELDRSTESTTRLSEKLRTYIRYWQSGKEQDTTEVFPRVLWIVPDRRRLEQLVDLFGRLPAEHWQLFAVTTADHAAQQLINGALVEPPTPKEVS